MDKIILGILILKRLTIYEIRNIISKNFKSMCSDSLGSIQAAIKKLLGEQMVTCSEFVEKSVNKKQYAITDLGRQAFMEWLKTPMDMSKTKNMDLGKLLLMGLVPAEERSYLLGELIVMLKKELSGLYKIQADIQQSDEKEQIMAYLEKDPEYSLGIQRATLNESMIENVAEIGFFEFITLQYGIDSIQFQIEWFEKLQNKVIRGDFNISGKGEYFHEYD